MTAPQLTLTYFDGTGRAELTRLTLAFGSVPFVDERIKQENFPALKPALPFGQLPVLQVGGTTYAQSMAIVRYTAKLSGLYPQDAVAALRVDMISETLSELTMSFIVAAIMEKDEAVKAEKIKTFVGETVPKTLGALDGMVQGEFFGGDSVSLADLHLFDLIENGLKPRVPEFSLAAFPKLDAVIAHVKANANIATYLAKSDALP